MPIGNNPIKINYPGNNTYRPANKDDTINVAKIPTTTTITVNNNTAGNVKVSRTVKDKYGRNVPEGTVTIKNGNTNLGTATVSNGAYTFTTTTLSKGSYNLVAQYTGTNTYLASNSPAVSVNILGQTPTITSKGEGDKVGNTSVNITLKDPTGKAVPNAPITVTLPNGTKVTGKTNNNGVAIIPVDFKEGTHINN